MRCSGHGLVNFHLPLSLIAHKQSVNFRFRRAVCCRWLHFSLLFIWGLVADFGLFLEEPLSCLKAGIFGFVAIEDKVRYVLSSEDSTLMRENRF